MMGRVPLCTIDSALKSRKIFWVDDFGHGSVGILETMIVFLSALKDATPGFSSQSVVLINNSTDCHYMLSITYVNLLSELWEIIMFKQRWLFGTMPKRFELQGGGTHRQTDKRNSEKYI